MHRSARFGFALCGALVTTFALVACGDDAGPTPGLNDTTGGGGGAAPTAGAGGSSAGHATTSGGQGGSISLGGGAAGHANGGSGGSLAGGKTNGGSGGSLAGGKTNGGSGGSLAGGKAGETSGGSGGDEAGGSAGASIGGTGGTGGSVAGGSGGSGGSTAGGSGGAGGSTTTTTTRLRFVLLSWKQFQEPVDICFGQNLTTPNGDDPGYVGPIAKRFSESVVSPAVSKYVANADDLPIGAGKITIRVVKAFTDCTVANRAVGTKDDEVNVIVEGADNTIFLFDAPSGVGTGLQATVIPDTVPGNADATLRLFNGIAEQPMEIYDQTDAPVDVGGAEYGETKDIGAAVGTQADLFVVVGGDFSSGVEAGTPTFTGGKSYSVYAVGTDKVDPTEVFAAACEDDKSAAGPNAFTSTACPFNPDPQGGG